jgi:hypothetical protein
VKIDEGCEVCLRAILVDTQLHLDFSMGESEIFVKPLGVPPPRFPGQGFRGASR